MKGFFVCFYKKNPSKYDFEGFCGGPTWYCYGVL